MTSPDASDAPAPLSPVDAAQDRRRLAVLCDVTRRLAATQDSDEIFTRIVHEATRLLDTDAAGLRLREGDELVLRARTAGAERLMSRTRLKVGESLSGHAIATRAPVIVEDLASDTRHDPAHKRGALELGYKSGLVVPLTAHGEVLGTLITFSKQQRRFSTEDVALLSAFADQAAVAIDKDRRALRLGALARVNQAISASLDLPQVLATIARATAELMGVPLVRFWIPDQVTQQLELRASSSGADATFPEQRIAFGAGGVGWVAEHRQTLSIPDVSADQRIRAHEWFAANGFTSMLASPIMLDATLLGVLVLVGRHPIVLELDDRQLLDSILAQAAVAIRNAAMYEEVRLAHARLERRTRSLDVLNRMGEMLQASGAAEDIYAVFGTFMAQLFPDAEGAVMVTSPSRDVLEPQATFAPAEGRSWAVFQPDECWALRRGRLHAVDRATSALTCRHFGPAQPEATLCVPLMAQGESLGLLCFCRPVTTSEPAWGEETQRLAQTIADQLGLAVANLKLRETLRNQSIRDPLTGLFNRRYMEETLERELKRATRTKSPLTVIMLDLDHFKRFNDFFGHAAGDLMLRELGGLLTRSVRGADVACRYGGEEFLLILPDTPGEIAVERIEELRDRVRQMHLVRAGDSAGTITVSAGLAVFPDSAHDAEGLVRAADAALYRAKMDGRDRVVVAELSV